MTRITSRQRLLLGALTLVGGAGAIDLLVDTPAPTAAQASARPGIVVPRVVSGDVEALITALQFDSAQRPPLNSDLPRDPFVLSPALAAVVAPALLEPEAEAAAVAVRATLELSAVITGPRPLAVINDQIVSVGAVVAEWEVKAIDAAGVTLRQGAQSVQLRLADDRDGVAP